MHYIDKQAQSDREIAELFAEFFSSVYSSSNNFAEPHGGDSDTFSICDSFSIDEQSIFDICKHFNISLQ